MILTISDIIYINEAARNLKQKDAMWIRDKLVGIDNMNYIIYAQLDVSKLSILPNRGIIFNQRDLSKFTKSISVESKFEIDETSRASTIATITEVMIVTTSQQIEYKVISNLTLSGNTDVSMQCVQEEDMSVKLQDLYNMSKTSGAMQYKYDSLHILTLFSGILPLAKSDKLFIKIFDVSENIFLARFRIQKKQFNIFTYIQYLKI